MEIQVNRWFSGLSVKAQMNLSQWCSNINHLQRKAYLGQFNLIDYQPTGRLALSGAGESFLMIFWIAYQSRKDPRAHECKVIWWNGLLYICLIQLYITWGLGDPFPVIYWNIYQSRNSPPALEHITLIAQYGELTSTSTSPNLDECRI